MVYSYVQADGLGMVAVTDKEYPSRVAVTMLKELLAAFKSVHAAGWRAAKEDGACRFPRLEEALREYQEPTQVDKIMKVNAQLAETKDMLVKTIDKVRARARAGARGGACGSEGACARERGRRGRARGHREGAAAVRGRGMGGSAVCGEPQQSPPAPA